MVAIELVGLVPIRIGICARDRHLLNPMESILIQVSGDEVLSSMMIWS